MADGAEPLDRGPRLAPAGMFFSASADRGQTPLPVSFWGRADGSALLAGGAGTPVGQPARGRHHHPLGAAPEPALGLPGRLRIAVAFHARRRRVHPRGAALALLATAGLDEPRSRDTPARSNR